ncbi:MAG TPA: hypothetical protein VG963_14430, partial [Polyangiaceae bacterium]|nr:hypothetical protein [Polyangiaceae bacterium]
MSGGVPSQLERAHLHIERPALGERVWVRRALIAAALGFLGFFLLLPLAVVFASALRDGIGVYAQAIV